MKRFDYLVVGAGIAGLSFALKISWQLPHKKIGILCKDNPSGSNTFFAQGGIAAVTDFEQDSFFKHQQDTMRAGNDLNNENVVAQFVEEAPERIKDLIDWGVKFDKNAGKWDLALEGGHSAHRIFHKEDATGAYILKILSDKAHQLPNIEFLNTFFAVDLITNRDLLFPADEMGNNSCYGVYALDSETGMVENLLAGITLLATGGAGQVFQKTTNPPAATGDGIAMAYRANAKIENMAYYQFHPTALVTPENEQALLISEALRGAGAVLKNCNGDLFMHKFDPREALAPRDIVARAIYQEMETTHCNYVYLDARNISENKLKSHFRNIYQKCHENGYSMEKDLLPVAPAAHYLCGGVNTGLDGTTNINRLYACGECAHTGLHGANRLASNSLIEALVMAHKMATQVVSQENKPLSGFEVEAFGLSSLKKPEDLSWIRETRRRLKMIMENNAGIVRTESKLQHAKSELEEMFHDVEIMTLTNKNSRELFELRNMVTVAFLIVEDCLFKKESHGAHYMEAN